MRPEMLRWIDENGGKTYGNFIGGEWIKSGSERSFPIYNAADSRQLLGIFPDSDADDVDQAVQAAHMALPSWSKLPAPERGQILNKFASLLEENVDVLAYMLSAEQGKVLSESRSEVMRAVKEARFVAGEAFRIEGVTLPSERANVQASVAKHPIGVIAAIAPWNFPVVTPVRKIAPALAYGCTVVYKPASFTPWSATLLMDLLAAAGVPKGVVNLVIGGGQRVGDPLVTHPLVKGISFTGSTALGKEIHVKAASRFAKTQLELGGKNPAIVINYADVQKVAREIVTAAFVCTGQRCTAISRVIVLQEKADDVTIAILAEVNRLKVGPAWDPSANIGPLINESHTKSVLDYVDIGLREGAVLACGGQRLNGPEYGDGNYVMPTVFTNVTSSMRIAQEEIFGPVLSIITVADIDEAITVANSVDYGLAACAFTMDLAQTHKLCDELESGMVHINHGTASEPHVPFGGTKQSGFGPFSIGYTNAEFFTELRAVFVKHE